MARCWPLLTLFIACLALGLGHPSINHVFVITLPEVPPLGPALARTKLPTAAKRIQHHWSKALGDEKIVTPSSTSPFTSDHAPSSLLTWQWNSLLTGFAVVGGVLGVWLMQRAPMAWQLDQKHSAMLHAFQGTIVQFSASPRRTLLPLHAKAQELDEDDDMFPADRQRRPSKKFVSKPFAYHEELEVIIDNVTNLGLGVGRYNGWVIFVPFVLKGERVKARIFRNHKNYSEADLVEVLEPSPHRVDPHCSLFGTCAGCQYQNLEYDQQLELKRQQVVELLEHMAGLKDVPVEPPIPSPQTYGYRAKITPHFFRPKPDSPRKIGFLQCGTCTTLIDVPQCPIATPEINVQLTEMRQQLQANSDAYKKGGTLLLRHSGPHTVVSDPGAVCEERVGNLVFQHLARDFFQNNLFILPAFVEHVKQQALGLGATHLVDAYCGCGLFALSCADAFQEVAGVEVTPSSIVWAETNAQFNGINNVAFHLGQAESIFAKVSFPPSSTAIVIDPPRKGCSEEFLDQVIRFGPLALVYVSCNPATQMRDLVRLREGGYEVVKVQPVDLFPQTRHLECVVTCRKVTAGTPTPAAH